MANNATMMVYRIETPDGKGICASTGSSLCTLYNRHCFNECEHCSLDTLKNRELWLRRKAKAEYLLRNGSYAFPSLQALKTWFPSPSGRKLMKDKGARVIEFEVDSENTMVTEYQCVFDKSDAKKIGELDLETLR